MATRKRVSRLTSLLSQLLYLLMHMVRPLIGPPNGCRYTITCTEYAKYQVANERLHIALWNILRRLLTCNPFSR